MAYQVTSRSSKPVQPIGISSNPKMAHGVVALSGGVATVTIPGSRRVVCAFVSPQSANATTVSATGTSTFAIAGTSSDVVMWFALYE